MTSDQLADLFTPDEVDNAGLVLRTSVEELRRALIEATDAYVDALTDGRTVPPERFQAWRRLSGLGIDAHKTPEQRAEEGIARAAAKWTAEEVTQVDAAIATVARRAADHALETPGYAHDLITTADVWAELGPGFPVTKGIAGRMTAAKGAGLIVSTGETTYPPTDAPEWVPNNGQRLTVWRALP